MQKAVDTESSPQPVIWGFLNNSGFPINTEKLGEIHVFLVWLVLLSFFLGFSGLNLVQPYIKRKKKRPQEVHTESSPQPFKCLGMAFQWFSQLFEGFDKYYIDTNFFSRKLMIMGSQTCTCKHKGDREEGIPKIGDQLPENGSLSGPPPVLCAVVFLDLSFLGQAILGTHRWHRIGSRIKPPAIHKFCLFHSLL